MNITKRYEKERQMETEKRIMFLRIQRLEKMLAEELDPFDEEYDRTADTLRDTKAALYAAAIESLDYHQETLELEAMIRSEREAARTAARREAWKVQHPRTDPVLFDRLHKTY